MKAFSLTLRRAPECLAAFLAFLCGGCGSPSSPPRETGGRAAADERVLWKRYQNAHISREGRVIDNANGGISHSEGQGYGLLIAQHLGDLEAFDRLWFWTKDHLRRPGDRLHAWRWEEGAGVTDPNNATDGDLLIAWALFRAARQWDRADLLEEARALLSDIRSRCVRSSPVGLILLPGVHGFDRPEGQVVNPSYWVWPAFDEFVRQDAEPHVWEELRATGLRLLRTPVGGALGEAGSAPSPVIADQALAHEGEDEPGGAGETSPAAPSLPPPVGPDLRHLAGLPPDWLLITPAGDLRYSDDAAFPPVFGYNAVRVPLYLLWAGFRQESLLKPYGEYLRRERLLTGGLRATVDLRTGARGDDPAMPGGEIVLALAQHHLTGAPWLPPALPGESGTYYSDTLWILAIVANGENS